MTQFIGVIGYPLKHSISPVFQQAALDHYSLDMRYVAWETPVDRLAERIQGLRLPQNLGANVTVPHKEAVLTLLDEIDESARQIGAVNTIVNRNGRLTGYNTDAYGFIEALRVDADCNPEGKRVVLIGAGGAARAAGFAVLMKDVTSLAITNRTVERAESVADSLREYASVSGRQVTITVVPMADNVLQSELLQADIIINATSFGMKHGILESESPIVSDMIREGVLVYDMVYNPTQTPLMRMAQSKGAIVTGGLSMLVLQGSASFEQWVGKQAPVDIMMQAARKTLTEM